MKPHFAIFAALAASSIFALASAPLEPLPHPWFVSGEAPQQYVAGIDRQASDSQAGAKYIASREGSGKSWAALMRFAAADQYRGQRIRFQARVRTRDVAGWAGLWLRVDGVDGKVLAFYNSQDKPIKGSSDWQQRSVTLEVPAHAHQVALGVINHGGGEVWIDDLKLQAVGEEAAVDRFPSAPPPAEPVE